MKPARDLSLDYLRAIGLLLIILAHVEPPRLLLHIRSFDVILMVIVSTISYGCFSKKGKPYREYVVSRFKRLVFPTWQFIILSAMLFGVCDYLLGKPLHFTPKSIIIGLLTFSGIGYLWVIRVFLYNAFLNPFIVKVRNLSPWNVYILVISGIMLSQVILIISREIGLEAIAEITIINMLAYSCVAALGFYFYVSSSHSQRIQLVAYSVLTFITFCKIGDFIPNTTKYPPQFPYLIYGLTVSCILLYIFRISKVERKISFLIFISSNSFWIYFWHVILLNIFSFYADYLTFYAVLPCCIKWISITACSCMLCLAQNQILKIISKK